ncbi:MAG: class I SAM-dependent methyltransferase [Proteobacteria bacterium]|nr:class I SAM-dependent methyltransferase [Burkholderiales bacterium]
MRMRSTAFTAISCGALSSRSLPVSASNPERAAGQACRRALEMGCYRGEFTSRLAGAFDDLTVIEGAAELVAAVRARVPERVRVVHARFEDWQPAPDEAFDAVFLMHTLEHLDDPVAVLRRIGDWLAPAGRLYLVVPNANAPSRQIAVKMGLIAHHAAVTEGEHRHGHRRTYAFDTLEHEVRCAGLRVVHRAGILFKPLANFQIDRALEAGIIDHAYLEGCYQLGMQYPDLCASLFLLCERRHDERA